MKSSIIHFVLLLALASIQPASSEVGWNQDNDQFKPAKTHEDSIEAFLDGAKFDTQQLFSNGRFPNIVVAMDGSVIAVFGKVQFRRSEDGGRTWSDVTQLAKGFSISGLTVDEISEDILAFMEDAHPPSPLHLYRSTDHGKTWKKQEFTLHPNSMGHTPALHMNENGISLRHGRFKGRLVVPCRWYGRTNYPPEYFHTHYTNAMFSDDGGRTWKASEPVPIMGTGEASIAELGNGTLYYNTRRHWAPNSEDALQRWSASSSDAGQTWKNPTRSKVLPDGNTNTPYGLMGGLVRLPVQERDILIFSNIVNDKARRNGHVWASFDGGKTWPVKQQVFNGNFAYSTLNAGRPNTPSAGLIYLLYEGGPEGGGTIARFNLKWILEGEKTGDGDMPDWITVE